MLGIKNMVKQNLLTKKIKELNLSNLDLVSKIAQTISNNSKLSAAEALDDSVQNKLTPAYVDSWRKGKAIPTNPIIRDALATILHAPEDNFLNLILNSEDAKQILLDSLNKYNLKIMADNLNDFKIKAAYGDFDRIKQNPYSSKVTSKDIMGCIAYLKISGYLFSKNLGLEKNKKLNLKLYKQILDLPRLTTLVNPDQLLHFLQKSIEKKGTININVLHKSALLYLLLIITGNDFFQL